MYFVLNIIIHISMCRISVAYYDRGFHIIVKISLKIYNFVCYFSTYNCTFE